MNEQKRWSLHKHDYNGGYVVTPESMNAVNHSFVKNFQVPTPYFLCACAYKDVYKGLEDLGYTDPEPTVERVDGHIYKVTLNNEYFGMYDTQRKTFVD